ncbi:MAG: YfcE family phosphodiesterase [Erysipelotrichaceae bacterium]
MKIVVVSDSHGKIQILQDIYLKHQHEAQYFLHLGDIEADQSYVSDYICVCGNNDYFGEYELERVVHIPQHNIFMCHSHQFFSSNRISGLVSKGKRLHCDIVCYGHTHVFHYEVKDNIVLLNPGSLYYNRDGSGSSYAIIDIENNQINITRINL